MIAFHWIDIQKMSVIWYLNFNDTSFDETFSEAARHIDNAFCDLKAIRSADSIRDSLCTSLPGQIHEQFNTTFFRQYKGHRWTKNTQRTPFCPTQLKSMLNVNRN